MPKMEHWTDSLPLAVLMTVSFFAGCLTATKFPELGWETLLAGLFGLVGGSFALLSVSYSTKKNEQKASLRFARHFGLYANGLVSSIQLAKQKVDSTPGLQNRLLVANTAMDTIRNRILNELTPPQDSAPIDIQTSYDQLITSIRLRLNPATRQSQFETETDAYELFDVVIARLEHLDNVCKTSIAEIH